MSTTKKKQENGQIRTPAGGRENRTVLKMPTLEDAIVNVAQRITLQALLNLKTCIEQTSNRIATLLEAIHNVCLRRVC